MDKEPIEVVSLFDLKPFQAPPANGKALSDLLMDFTEQVQEFLLDAGMGEEAGSQAALQLADVVQKNWGGIPAYVPGYGHHMRGRFLEEVEVWSTTCLQAFQVEDPAAAAAALVDHLWKCYGLRVDGEKADRVGQSLYFPKRDPLLYRRIALTLTRDNVVDLARETGLTPVRLYQIREEETRRMREQSKAGKRA